MTVRGSGILLHVTSLPSPHGVGDLGPGARLFVDRLAQAGQRYWQMLPMGPTSPAIGNSPYSSCSAFAGNPLVVSPEQLAADGWLDPRDIPLPARNDPWQVHYEEVHAHKDRILRQAWLLAAPGLDAHPEFRRFLADSPWLEDYTLFVTLKARHNGAVWTDWPAPYRDRNPDALAAWKQDAAAEIQYEAFVQFLFFSQWQSLRDHCRRRRVQLVGDAPIYVTFDSADVWAHPGLFKLGPDRQPLAVAGVPPDYFSETGQLWGNPVYDWNALLSQGYRWWVARLGQGMTLYDIIRLDHFRGFAGYWEVPAGEKTAINGQWVDAPGMEFFSVLLTHLPHLRLIAEDLGVITADVRELKQTYGFPGMHILQFAFGPEVGRNIDAPHLHKRNSVVYTGTHDNQTTLSWWFEEASAEDRARVLRYAGAGLKVDPVTGQGVDEPHWLMIRLALSSVADTCIIPLQDVLGMGKEARMNTPGLSQGNWAWRVAPEALAWGGLERLGELCRLFGRA